MGVESGSQAVLNAMDKGLRSVEYLCRPERGSRKPAFVPATSCSLDIPAKPGLNCNRQSHWCARLGRTISASPSPTRCPAPCSTTGCRRSLGQKRNWTDSDDLCIMFKAAYNTDFYRAVREALHAEVDSWHEGRYVHEARRRIDALWDRVDELEAVSRQPDAFVPSESISIVPSSAIMPVPRLAQPTEA